MTAGAPQGHHRVAAFLLSLERDAAARVLKTIDPEVVPGVARAMVELDPELGTPKVVDDLWHGIARALNGPRTVRACKEDALLALVAETYGEKRAAQIVEGLRERRRQERPFHALERYPAGLIHRALRDESAAAKALVLSRVSPAVAGEVIRWLDEEEATEVVRRMATLETPPIATMHAIAASLEETLAEMETAPPVPDPGERLQSVAKLLSYTSPDIEKGVIESIAGEDADLASELRELMFTWSDIASIDKRSMQKILGTVDTKTLSIALKGCAEEIEANVMSNLSERVRAMVGEERDLAGAVPRTEVDSARDEIMKNIRAMIEAGEFSPSRKGEELVT